MARLKRLPGRIHFGRTLTHIDPASRHRCTQDHSYQRDTSSRATICAMSSDVPVTRAGVPEWDAQGEGGSRGTSHVITVVAPA
ncbi:hypothetical protein GCM10023328_45410 [Modestobacter marinus]|uniref:Uncharacterized protein n=1 Tax=Modestobacter marinus TaxID=477641 RepID=A0ABQ2GC94_9ACTN|nr:hypothetical protein GCM10011589_48080 [Modestobacter marinus]